MHHPHLMEDKDLIGLYLRGNQHAFETLYKRHKDRIFSTIYYLVNDRELAEDLFQETFIKIVSVLKDKRYNEEGKFIAWAIRVAHNLVIDYFRVKKNKMKMIRANEDYDPLERIHNGDRNAMEEMIYKEKAEMVKAMVERLPQAQREVIVLRHYGELSFKEISEILGVNLNTVLGRAHYGIISMRKMMPGKSEPKSQMAESKTQKKRLKPKNN